LAAVEQDYSSAGLDDRRLAILTYASKLNLTPGQMRRADLEALRTHGLSDTDILHIAELVGYYAYVNRIASGLGVELEDEDS
jgi:uncharacterized peroxidase-related enzyme